MARTRRDEDPQLISWLGIGASKNYDWYQRQGQENRSKTLLSLDDARRLVDQFVRCYNDVCLHSAIGYVAPKARLTGQDQIIFAERKRKLAQAQKKR